MSLRTLLSCRPGRAVGVVAVVLRQVAAGYGSRVASVVAPSSFPPTPPLAFVVSFPLHLTMIYGRDVVLIFFPSQPDHSTRTYFSFFSPPQQTMDVMFGGFVFLSSQLHQSGSTHFFSLISLPPRSMDVVLLLVCCFFRWCLIFCFSSGQLSLAQEHSLFFFFDCCWEAAPPRH